MVSEKLLEDLALFNPVGPHASNPFKYLLTRYIEIVSACSRECDNQTKALSDWDNKSQTYVYKTKPGHNIQAMQWVN